MRQGQCVCIGPYVVCYFTVGWDLQAQKPASTKLKFLHTQYRPDKQNFFHLELLVPSAYFTELYPTPARHRCQTLWLQRPQAALRAFQPRDLRPGSWAASVTRLGIPLPFSASGCVPKLPFPQNLKIFSFCEGLLHSNLSKLPK